MTMISVFARTACAGGLLFAGISAAAAQDVEATLERLRALMAEQAVEVEWSAAEIDGDAVTLRGVTATGPEGEEVELGDFHLSGVDDRRIGEMRMDHYVFSEEGATVTAEGVVLTGIMLPDEELDDDDTGFFFYERATMSRLSVEMDDTEVFALNGLDISVTPAADGAPLTFTGVADGFSADLSTVEDETSREIIARMGYEQITGTFDTRGSWQPEDGRLTLTNYDLTVTDGGTLGFAFDIGGYTPEFVRALGEMQRAAAAGDDATGGMAMLGLMQQLSLHGADFYFRDDSLTGRVLEVLAEEQGMRPQDVVNQAKAVMPFMLAQIGVPQLATMISQAVSQYLDDPQSIRISARPSEPVPFALLMAGAMASPEALVQQIGVEVVAND